MKRFIAIVLSVLILSQALILASCQNGGSETDNTQAYESNSKIESETDETAPEQADEFADIRASHELWLSYGLRALTEEKEIPDLTQFFSSQSNLVYLTLFNDMFYDEADKSIPVAEALFRFVYEKHGTDALTDIEKRITYKNEFLLSLNSELVYNNPQDYETMMAGMITTSDDTYSCIITIDRATFYFKDFSKGSASQYHGLLYYNVIGLTRLESYIKENNLTSFFDVTSPLEFYMLFDGSGVSYTNYKDKKMYINDYSSMLHEAIHAMGIQDNNQLWLSEGLCDYFGKLLGCNEQIAAGYIQTIKAIQSGKYDSLIASGNQEAARAKVLADKYVEKGGTVGLVSEFDMKLYTNLMAIDELESPSNTTLANVYRKTNGKEYQNDGGELTYNQAASIISWLVEQFGIQKVMEAYRSGDTVETFVVDYATLKEQWVSYLSQY